MGKKKNHVSWGKTPHLNKQLKNIYPEVTSSLPTRQILTYVYRLLLKNVLQIFVLGLVCFFLHVADYDLLDWKIYVLVFLLWGLIHFSQKKEIDVLYNDKRQFLLEFLSMVVVALCTFCLYIFLYDVTVDVVNYDSVKDVKKWDADYYVFKEECVVDTTKYGEDILRKEWKTSRSGLSLNICFTVYYTAPVVGTEDVYFAKQLYSDTLHQSRIEKWKKDELAFYNAFMKRYNENMRANQEKILSRVYRLVTNHNDLEHYEVAMTYGWLKEYKYHDRGNVYFLEASDYPHIRMGFVYVFFFSLVLYSFFVFLIYRNNGLVVSPTPFAWGDCKHK